MKGCKLLVMYKLLSILTKKSSFALVCEIRENNRKKNKN
jgi:hypothetical protein